MAKRARKRRPARPGVILNPDVADDQDDDPPTMGIPDDDGWVYLKRTEANKRGTEKRRKPGRR
jgi:hypothetical protein